MELPDRGPAPGGPSRLRPKARRRYAPERRGRLAIGSCIGRGVKVWARNLPAFAALSAIVYLPLVAYGFYALSDVPDEMTSWDATFTVVPGRLAMWHVVRGIADVFLPLVVTGAIAYATVQDLRGTPAGIGRAIGVGLSRLLPVLGIVLVLACALIAFGFVAGVLASLLSVLGALAALVIALMAMCALWVTIPAAVVERTGVWGSFRRSLELTRGNKAAVFVVLLVLVAVNWGLDSLLAVVLYSEPGAFGSERVRFLVETGVSSVLFGSLAAAVNAVGYHDLRVTRDGVTIEEIARVFD